MAQIHAPPGEGWNEKLQDGTTVRIRSPVTPVHAPERTASAKA